jgi:FkbM family methyltransferase
VKRVSPFVTYAQNFEDLMIWRAVHDVGRGFYIDVGAADPDEDSVTRAFYDRGWHGINIEPSPAHFAALSAARPRDINLDCLLGAAAGRQRLYNIPDTGLSTVDGDIAASHASEGYPSDEVSVPVRTLAEICREFAPPDIHFLKIDVEGAEAEVLSGADFATYRPWIVIVEATMPMSQTQNWQGWDKLLVQAAYHFVWFDGLNRFYLAQEQRERLEHAFQTPPNVFDGWVRPQGQMQLQLLRRLAASEDSMARLRDEAQASAVHKAGADAARAEASAARAEARALAQDAAIARMEASSARRAEGSARQERDAAVADCARLRDALEEASRALSGAQSERDIALADLHRARADAQAERHALDLVRHEKFLAEAMLAAMQRSTSWRLTRPLRGVGRVLRARPLNRGRLSRLIHIGTLGRGKMGAAGMGRVAVYGMGRVMARLPFLSIVPRMARSVLPGPYGWLRDHYRAYRKLAEAAGDATPLYMQNAMDSALPMSPGGQAGATHVSAEEQDMLLRLSVHGQPA